jgi:hypothetical protein
VDEVLSLGTDTIKKWPELLRIEIPAGNYGGGDAALTPIYRSFRTLRCFTDTAEVNAARKSRIKNGKKPKIRSQVTINERNDSAIVFCGQRRGFNLSRVEYVLKYLRENPSISELHVVTPDTPDIRPAVI